MKRRKNAVPKSYKAYFITAGLAGYPDGVGGNVLVQKPALDKMLSTFRGMPVVNLEHTDLEPEELFNMDGDDEKADGVVSATGYDESSGWYWAEMMVWDEDTQKNIDARGYSVSCAYDVLDLDDSGGTYNNVDYKEEVLDGEYIHMAIVPNPRYEKAYIIKNSKQGEQTVKVKFFPSKGKKVKNSDPPEAKEEEETVENMEEVEGVVVLEDGTEVPMEELVNTYRQKKNEADEETVENGTVFGMDDEIEIDGEKMTVQELMSAAGYGETKENEAALLDEDAEEVVDETIQNSTKKKPVRKSVKNAAGSDSLPFVPDVNLEHTRLKNGKSRYGSVVKQEDK